MVPDRWVRPHTRRSSRAVRSQPGPAWPLESPGVSAEADHPIGASARLEGFDGLRAIAVLSVASYHFFQTAAVFPTGATTAFDIGGQFRVGVWVFFVLSGFLLYRPYARAHAGAGRQPSPVRYTRSRFLRIWPAYAVTLVVLTYVWHRVAIDGTNGFVLHLVLVQNYVPSQFLRGGIGPAWSLVVEVAFYAFLPVYAAIVGRYTKRRDPWTVELVSLAAVAVLGFAWQIAMVGHPLPATMLPGFLPTFAIGMTFAVAVVHRRDLGLSSLARRPAVCWLVALALLVGKGIVGGFDFFELGFEIQNQIVYSAVAALVVVPAVFGARDRLANRVLRSRPFHGLGLISYGVFLWSVPVMQAVQQDWIPLEPGFAGRTGVVAVVSVAVTCAIATLSWFVVERPALAFKGRARARRVPPADGSKAAGG